MRRIRYAVAMSLDGYIAGPNDEFDWIIMDPEIDFGALFAQFDTFLLGRRTYEAMQRMGEQAMGGFSGQKTVVISSTMRPENYAEVTVVSDDVEKTVQMLKQEPGRDIWLFGGGVLFRSLLAAGLVDTVEPAIVPIILGRGIPFVPPPAEQTSLKLTSHRLYAKTGIMQLEYAVVRDAD